MADGERRLAAIMFTDIVGFAALTQDDEAEALARLETHNRLLRPLFPRFHGTEVKSIGDAFLVEFPSALEAARCAIEIQRTLQRHNAAHSSAPIEVRIGVHLGDVVHSAGDVFGDAVNIASRIEPLADPGGICVSEAVREQLRNKLAASFEPLPPSDLKNIGHAVGLYRLEADSDPPAPDEAGPSRGTRHRLAVLPFTNMSPDPEDEFFADGLTEELIAELARVPGCEVIARTSVMRYKTAPRGIREVGRELRVDVVLEGSVRKSANQLRITAQLIDVKSEAHLWADRFDRELRRVFELQTEIATRVADALQVELEPRDRAALGRFATPNFAAYELYLRGRQLWWAAGEQNYRNAILYFKRAVALDPRFALAYCGLADSYALLGNHGNMPLADALAMAEPAARTALQLDPNLADAHASLAPVLYNRYDWAGAEAELRRAVTLDPNSVLGHYWLAVCLAARGQLAEALRESRRSAELDPFSRQAVLQPAFFLYYLRDYVGALDHLQEVEARLGVPSYVLGSLCELGLGRTDAALEHARKSLTGAWETSPSRRAILAVACARAGHAEESDRLLAGLIADWEKGRVPAGPAALVYAARGETDAAFDWFEKAYRERSAVVVEDLLIDPLLDDLRKDPRFVGLLRRFNFA